MSHNEDLLRSAYRRPVDLEQLDRMNAFVRQLDRPASPPAQRRWTTPLSIAAAVAVLVTGTVLAVTGDRGVDRRNEHPATSPGTTSDTPLTRSATTAATRPPAVPPAAHAAVVSADPAFGSLAVSPLDSFRITVTSGHLQSIAVTDPAGHIVTGTFDGDRTSWTSTGKLAYGTRYRVIGSAQGTDRAIVPINGTFGTVAPAAQVTVAVSPASGATVGVGQPVSLTFPAGLDLADRASIQQRLTVTTSVPVNGSWGWVRWSDGTWRADWRPREFWPANTRVHVQGNLFGVRLNGGTYGQKDVSADFTIGRDQQLKIDADRGLLVVSRAGRPAASYPVTVPSSMKSGTSSVLATYGTLMSNRPGSAGPTASYWVLRISNVGRFIMAAPSGNAPTESALLSTADARSLFGQTLIGDPVSIVNAGQPLDPADDDINDWAYSWAQWQQLSAR